MKGDHHSLGIAQILGLAGRIHHALAAARSRLDAAVPGSGRNPTPEQIPALNEWVKKEIQQAQNRSALAEKSLAQSGQRLEAVRARLRRLMDRAPAAEAELARIAGARDRLRERMSRERAVRVDAVEALERRLMPPSEGRREGGASERLLAGRRRLKARYDEALADLKLKEAQFRQETDRLTERADRFAAVKRRLGEARRLEKSLARRLEADRALVVQARREVEGLEEARGLLAGAADDWSALQARLDRWPGDVRKLADQAASVERIDMTALKDALAGVRSARREAVPRIAQVRGSLTAAVDRADALSADLDRLSRDAQNAAWDLDRQVMRLGRDGRPETPVGRISRQLADLNQRRSQLLNRRDRLVPALGRFIDELDRQAEELGRCEAFGQKAVDRVVESIRSQTTRRGALALRSGSLRRQADELDRALPESVGGSPLVRQVMDEAVKQLDHIQETLDRAKDRLSDLHQRVSRLSPRSNTIDAESRNRAALARERLQDHDAGRDAFDRLPRQLAVYRAALLQSHRIDQVRDQNQRRTDQLTRLAKRHARTQVRLKSALSDRTRLNRELAAAATRITALDAAQNKLAADLDSARRRSAGLTEKNAELSSLLEDVKRRRAQMARAHQELNQSLDAAGRRAEAAERDNQALRRGLKRSGAKTAAQVRRNRDLSGRLQRARTAGRKLADEKQVLVKQLAETENRVAKADRHQQTLQARIDRADRDNRRLTAENRRAAGQLQANRLENHRLTQQNQKLTGVFDRTVEANQRLERDNQKLGQDLSSWRGRAKALHRHVQDDLRPLVETLGQALYQSGLRERHLAEAKREMSVIAARHSALAQNQKHKRHAAEGALAQMARAATLLGYESETDRREFEAARQRLQEGLDQARGRVGALEEKIKELEADRRLKEASHKKAVADLNVRLALAQTNHLQAEEHNEQLYRRLQDVQAAGERRAAQFRSQRRRLGRAARTWTRRSLDLQNQLDRLSAEREDLLALIHRQADEVQDGRDRLAEVAPLLSFFLERIDLRDQPPPPAPLEMPEGSELLVVMIHLLGQENEHLRETAAGLAERERDLARENDHLSRSHRAVKDRLTALLPLFHFFFTNWLSTTAALAETQHRASRAENRIGDLKNELLDREADLSGLAGRLSRLTQDLGETTDRLDRSETARGRAEGLLTRYRELHEEARDQIQALEASRNRLNRIAAQRQSTIESLTADRDARAVDQKRLADQVAAWSARASGLAEDREHLGRQLADQRNQNAVLTSALAVAAERTGQLVSDLQSELTAQAETIFRFEKRLEDSANHAAELERTQDRLALLLWMMVKYGGDNDEVYTTLLKLVHDRGFKDAAGIAGRRLAEIGASAAALAAGENFRRRAARAVRRGVYSLLFAGGVIFTWPQESSKATALPSDLGKPKTVLDLVSETPKLDAAVSDGPVYHPWFGRTFIPDAVPVHQPTRTASDLTAAVTDRLEALARGYGLSPTAYRRLVRTVYGPDQAIRLEALADPGQALNLLADFFPHLAAEIRSKDLTDKRLRGLYRLAGAHPDGETRFWDRLYSDFRHMGAEGPAALDMVLSNAAKHREFGDEPVEFAGRLEPIDDLERLDLTTFLARVTPYLQANIKFFVSHPAYAYAHEPDQIEGYARTLAEDMYSSARLFGVPLTLMISIAHQESYFANVLGDNAQSASPFQIYAPTKPLIIKTMKDRGLATPGVPEKLEDHLTLATYMAAFYLSGLIDKHTVDYGKDKKLMCDLDRVARSYNGGSAYPGHVHKKKLRLARYLAKTTVAKQ